MTNRANFVTCSICGFVVRKDRLGRHKSKVHKISRQPLGKMVKCEICQADVREDRLTYHKERVHLKTEKSGDRYIHFDVAIHDKDFESLSEIAKDRNQSCQEIVAKLVKEFISWVRA